MRDDSAEILFYSFLREALVSTSGIDKDVLSVDVVHLAFFFFFFLTSASPALPFGNVFIGSLACDMPEPCKFPSLCGSASRGSCKP